MSIEAMKLALEALEDCVSDDITPYQLTKTITSLRQAIEQAESVTKEAEKTRRFIRQLDQAIEQAQQAKPLTDEELRELADKHLFYQLEGYEASGVLAFARAIEAAHGIKEST